jgi:transposase-like protein
MDGIVVKVCQGGKVKGKTIYLMIRLKHNRLKEVISMRISETESTRF